MGKGYVWRLRQELSPEDKRTFDWWLTGNAVAGAIFGAGLVAMAVLSSHGGPSDKVLASHETAANSRATVAVK